MSESLSEAARRIASRSCREQGLDARVTDAAILGKLAALIRSSDAPDRIDAIGVEPVAATDGGVDNDVLDQGGEDGSLAA